MSGSRAGEAVINGPAWSDDRIALLKKLVTEGLTYSVIGKQLGCTRNAAIGKATRLGLKQPESTARINRRHNANRAAAVANQKAASKSRPLLIIAGCGAVIEKPPGLPPRTPESFNPDAWKPRADTVSVTIMALSGLTCRWPVTIEGEAEPHFCGARPKGEGVYCAHHAKIAYQPAPKGKRTANELARSLRRYA